MLTLWGRANSANVKKVLWTLEELGITYEHISVGGSYGGLDDPAYLAMNPNGLIPMIKDDDLVLWESNTIVRYLACRYGCDSLWIDDCGKRATAEKWMDWTVSVLFKPFQKLLYHSVRLPENQRDPAILLESIHDFEKGLAIIEQTLEKQDWLSGETFGISDIIAGTFVYYYYEIDTAHYRCFPHTQNWYERLKTRPAYRKTIMLPIT